VSLISVTETVREDLVGNGWSRFSADWLNLWSDAFMDAHELQLAPDPRAPGKMHARDVFHWRGSAVMPKRSIAFTTERGDVVDDFSRMDVSTRDLTVPLRIIRCLPDGHREHGEMSADYFRYSPGVESSAHRDGFGTFVFIWTLRRAGTGGVSYLTNPDGSDAFRGVLGAGEILAFDDSRFLHGFTALEGTEAIRDVVIFIALKP
jgi:2OG-Fe dioxygenase